MAPSDVLLEPEECVMLLIDFQAGLGFGVESIPRQLVLNNAVALARTGVAFKLPVVASTSASRVYSGPLLPALPEALPSVKAIERKNMNVWEEAVFKVSPTVSGLMLIPLTLAQVAVSTGTGKRISMTGHPRKIMATGSAIAAFVASTRRRSPPPHTVHFRC